LGTATTELTLMKRVRVVAVAIAALATAGLLMRWLTSEPAHETSAPAVDITPAPRALEAVRKAWVDELEELTESVRTRAVANDTYEFVARPNIPYVYERYTPEQLVTERIDTVLIINGRGNPLFWRRVNDRQNRGFPDADEFLAELPSLSAPSAPGEPALAGAVRLARGPSLVVAMPIYPAARTGPARGWLIAARALDAAQWRRYAERAHVDVEALDPRTSEWPADATNVPGKPPVPVLRVEANGIRGWLPVYDVKGQRLRLFSVAVAKPPAPVKPIAPPKTRANSLWFWSAALLAALVGALLLRVRHRGGAARSGPSVLPPTITSPRPVTAATVPVPAPVSGAPHGVPSSTTPLSAAAALERHDAVDLEAIFDSGDLASSSPSIRIEEAPAGRAVAPAPAAAAAAEDSSSCRQGRLRERLAAATWVLRYQPQVDVHSDRIEGVEALLCIAEGGKERPATEVIAEAEAAGIELEVIERWLHAACRERHAWSREVDCEFPVAVPVPQHALEDAAFLPVLRRILEDCELTPRHLELEVQEAALTSSADALRALQEVRRCGISICIDGLGKGSLSLRSLTVVQITKVRIDAALIREAGHDLTASAVVRAIIGAAGALRIAVCTTGIDSAEQAAALAAHGRLLAQGVALGPPMEGERFLALLRNQDVDTAKLPILQVGDSARRVSGGTGSPQR
jgi:EAL domain-containing protein (putative c-di-GMP-specific phosphodiesterase class I)/sensor domain CHASE-containing protein